MAVSETGTQVGMELVVGEDFAAQIFWTDEYGEPVPVTDPVLMDVKDANGQIAMRFSTEGDPELTSKISYTRVGFFQLTAPRVVTANLVPGVYRFDLFAGVDEAAGPFRSQVRQVISGFVTALPRVTQLEDLTLAPATFTEATTANDEAIDTASTYDPTMEV